MSKPTKLWTIGHSNHSAEHFLSLLQQHGIETVVDVRSQPYSRFSPHFRQSRLRELLSEIGLDYLFLGDELGGRPKEPELYDDAGNVAYGRVARTERFTAGLHRLMATAATQRVAAMCSEENPERCHRRLLVARALLKNESAPTVMHIRGDGRLASESEMQIHESIATPQLALFDEGSPEKLAATRNEP